MTHDVVVYVVDDDETTRDSLRLMLKTVGVEAATYALPSEFIESFDPERPGCVVLDLRMPELNGIEVLALLRNRSKTVPVILLSGYGDLSAVVRAMKLGAVDFLEKPVNSELLLEIIQHWTQYDIKTQLARAQRQATLARLAKLSSRQRQVLECVLNGMSNKEIARQLGIGPKAIELHRAHVMHKMGARNVVNLVIEVAGCMKSTGQIEGCPSRLQAIEWPEPMHMA